MFHNLVISYSYSIDVFFFLLYSSGFHLFILIINIKTMETSAIQETSATNIWEESQVPNTSNVKHRPGIVYFSSVPPHMNMSAIKQYFEKYAKISNIFFQLSNLENCKYHTKIIFF